jgi:hypothetical protein
MEKSGIDLTNVLITYLYMLLKNYSRYYRFNLKRMKIQIPYPNLLRKL